jgi:hypothetical protein
MHTGRENGGIGASFSPDQGPCSVLQEGHLLMQQCQSAPKKQNLAAHIPKIPHTTEAARCLTSKRPHYQSYCRRRCLKESQMPRNTPLLQLSSKLRCTLKSLCCNKNPPVPPVKAVSSSTSPFSGLGPTTGYSDTRCIVKAKSTQNSHTRQWPWETSVIASGWFRQNRKNLTTDYDTARQQ